MLRSITELVFAPHCSQPVTCMPQMCGKLTGASAGRLFASIAAEQLVAADAEGVEPAVAFLGADAERLLQRRNRAQEIDARLQQAAVHRQHSRRFLPERARLPWRRDRRPAAPPGSRRTRRQNRDSRAGSCERALGLDPEILQEAVDQRQVRAAIHPHRPAVIRDLAGVAGVAVQPDHLDAGDLRRRERHADRQPEWVARALRIGDQAVALEVVHERPHVRPSVACADLGFERQRPVERKDLAAFRQVIEGRPFGVGQPVAAFADWRRGQCRSDDRLRRSRDPHPEPGDAGQGQAQEHHRQAKQPLHTRIPLMETNGRSRCSLTRPGRSRDARASRSCPAACSRARWPAAPPRWPRSRRAQPDVHGLRLPHAVRGDGPAQPRAAEILTRTRRRPPAALPTMTGTTAATEWTDRARAIADPISQLHR